MNKNRLRLCSQFTNAETLEQKEKRENKEYLERKLELEKMRRDFNAILRRLSYENRPWYKKIFD